jgi:serine/threonine-protein kinase HipA
MIHVEDMCQVMDIFPNGKYSMEFDAIMVAMERLAVSKAALLDALRLFVFSYLIGNGDLHAKNVSLIFEDGQWRLSPAYDLLSTLPYADRLTGADRMALALADESFGNYTVEEFVGFGERFAACRQGDVLAVSGFAGGRARGDFGARRLVDGVVPPSVGVSDRA